MPAPAVDALGVPQLDLLLRPVPDASTILIANDPGIEAEAFLYQAAHHHLENGRTVVYAVFNRPPSAVLRAMAEFGFAPHELRRRLILVDGYSARLGTSDPEAGHRLEDPSRFDELARFLGTIAEAHPGAVAILDPLSNFVDVQGSQRFVEGLPALGRNLHGFHLTIALFTHWSYPEPVLKALDAFDVVIACKAIEDRFLFGQYFSLQRARWHPNLATPPQLFRNYRPGGVHVYIPKIVVTGAATAGKTTFIHSVSETAKSANFEGRTVALDHGHAEIDGLAIDLFGTPGQERFDPILKMIAGQALGVVLMVDSTAPETFPRANEMLHKLQREGMPAIVVANKQDLPGALSAAEVERRLAPPAGVQVLPCAATDRGAARAVLRTLIDRVLKQGVGS